MIQGHLQTIPPGYSKLIQVKQGRNLYSTNMNRSRNISVDSTSDELIHENQHTLASHKNSGGNQHRLSYLPLNTIKRRAHSAIHDGASGRSTPIGTVNGSPSGTDARSRSKSNITEASCRADKNLKLLDKLLQYKQGGDCIRLDYYRCRFYGPDFTWISTPFSISRLTTSVLPSLMA